MIQYIKYEQDRKYKNRMLIASHAVLYRVATVYCRVQEEPAKLYYRK